MADPSSQPPRRPRIPSGYGNYSREPEEKRRERSRRGGGAWAEDDSAPPLERLPTTTSGRASALHHPLAPSRGAPGSSSSIEAAAGASRPGGQYPSNDGGGGVGGLVSYPAANHGPGWTPMLDVPPARASQRYTPMLDTTGRGGGGAAAAAAKRSPLERSAVNPFSDPYGGGGGGGSGGSRGRDAATRQGLLEARPGAPAAAAARNRGYGAAGGGGGGGGKRGGASSGIQRVGNPGASGGTMQPGGPGAGGNSGSEHIYFKHGLRLVETAEIRLEALSTLATWLVFLLPYLCLAAALWLDSSRVGITARQLSSLAGCSGNGVCVWEVEGAPPQNSFFKLTGNFRAQRGVTAYPPSTDKHLIFYTLGVGVEVSGLTSDGDWASLHTAAAADNRHTVRCAALDGKKSSGVEAGVCEPITLLHLRFDAPGLLGWYTAYRISTNTTVVAGSTNSSAGSGKGGSVSESVGEGAGLLMAGASLKLQSESPTYALAIHATRCVLVLLTTMGLLFWLGVACTERDGFLATSAERQWLTLMQIALLLWQNPVLAVLGCFSTARDRQLLGSDIIQSVGSQLLFFTWVSLMDGQHFVPEIPKHGFTFINGSGHDAGAGRDATWLADPATEAAMVSHGATEKMPAALKDNRPAHYFGSDNFIDFVAGKVAYMLLATAVAVAIDLLRHPEVTMPAAWLSTELQQAYFALSIAAGVLALGWVLWFSRATVRARRKLQKHPFMPTRRQQLTWRVMFMQGLLVSVLLVVSLAGPFYRLLRFLGAHTAMDVIRATWLEALGSEAAAFAAWGRGFRIPLGEQVFVTVICYTLVYLYLPPAHTVKRRHDRMYVSLESDLPPPEEVIRYKDSRELEPIFCLERACWLCEVSWQSYYDPLKLNLDSFIAPGRMDLMPLGLTLVADIEGGSLETRAMLCRGADRLVLAFRGTANISNAMLDLKVTQVPLPSLVPAARRSFGASSGGRNGEAADGSFYHPPMPGRASRGNSDSGDWMDSDYGVPGGGGGSGGGGGVGACLRAVLSAIPLARQTLPRVHQGFWEAYSMMRERVLQAVAAELQREYRPLFITGHSLGGALATLAAYDIHSNFKLSDNVTIYTFGSPCVGNYVFARQLRAKVPHHFRVVNDGDFVTRMPQFLGIYRHAGIKVLIDSDNYGTFIVSPSAVEDMFGSKRSVGAPAIHLLGRYRESLEACMEEKDLHEYLAKGYGLATGAKADLENVPSWLKEQRRPNNHGGDDG